MVSKKYLSQKKNSRQSISISPKLKARIENYVRTNQKKYPEDKRFKSTSSFYNYVMEKVLESFEKGKNLEDFDIIDDIEIVGALNQFTFRGTVPLHENALETNHFTDLNYKNLTSYFFVIRKFLMTTLNPREDSDIRKFSERYKNYLVSNKTTKDFRYEIIPGKNQRFPVLILEVTGLYRNITFEFFKFNAAVVGFSGIKLINFFYSERKNYGRCEYIPTELFYNERIMKQERLKLVKENVSFMVNYNGLLNDKDYYLWMKLAEDEDFFINYKEENSLYDMLNLTKTEIIEFGNRDELLLRFLQFFEGIHWIKIEDKDALKFNILLLYQDYPNEIEFLKNFLSEYSELLQKEGGLCLRK